MDYNSTFTLHTGIGATQQLNVYEDIYTSIGTNYVIFVDIGEFNTLFQSKTYEDFNDYVNQNVIINTTYLQQILNSTNSSVVLKGYYGAEDLTSGLEEVETSTVGGISTYTSGTRNFGYRLLELAALQIFNSATARAAISNDTEFIYGSGENLYTGQGETSGDGNLYSSLANQINYAFNVESNNIFNQYVNSWRYQYSNDINQYQTYNFDQSNFQIYMTFQANTYGINRGLGYTDKIANLYPTGFNKSILLVLSDSYSYNDIIHKYGTI
jgi:hypothetical protein